jgi:hypothetical protein
VNGVSSRPFLARGPTDQPATYVCLSYITLATVGYGDYTPAGNLPRALCSLEAVIGQIFLVTTVARLVSLYGARTSTTPVQGEKGGGWSRRGRRRTAATPLPDLTAAGDAQRRRRLVPPGRAPRAFFDSGERRGIDACYTV